MTGCNLRDQKITKVGSFLPKGTVLHTRINGRICTIGWVLGAVSYLVVSKGSCGPVLYPPISPIVTTSDIRYRFWLCNRDPGGCHRKYMTRCYLAVSSETKGPRALNLGELSLAGVCCPAQAPGPNNHGQCANENIRWSQPCSMSRDILVVICADHNLWLESLCSVQICTRGLT